tara:strand:- start:218 stop:664 length:447 start_codon:yes stop_codon:yes gene_type:complete
MNKSKRVAFTWDQEYKSPYVDLIREALSGFGEKTELSNTELFVLFMTVGFEAGVRREVRTSKSDAARLEYITESQKAMIKAVGLSQADSAESLLDEDEIYKVSEEFAAGGLFILAKEYDNQPDFAKWLKLKLSNFSSGASSVSDSEKL